MVGLSHGAAEKLLQYAWPGNVRELANCIERAVALTSHEQILVEDLPERIRDYGRAHVLVASDDPSELVPLEEVERRYVARVLEAVGGNKTLAARILGLDRKTLYRKLAPGRSARRRNATRGEMRRRDGARRVPSAARAAGTRGCIGTCRGRSR